MRHALSVPHASDPDVLARRLITRAHHRDGLPEILVGFSFLLVSGLITVQVLFPPGSMAFRAAALASAIGIPALCLGAPWFLKQLRARYLINRVGHVQFKPATRNQKMAGVGVGIMTAAAMAVIITQFSHPDASILAGTGLFGGALAAICGRLPRFVVGGVLIALLGVVLAAAEVPLPSGFAILFGVQGLALLLSGSAVLLRFLHH